jgi:hypothetical protein
LRRSLRELLPAAIVSSEASLNLCTLIAVCTLPRRKQPKLVLREVDASPIAQINGPYAQNRIAHRILRRFYGHAAASSRSTKARVAICKRISRCLMASFR